MARPVRYLILIGLLCLAMLLPYLPGRFDASAATLSFLAQVAGYASVLFVPIGVAWMISRRSTRLWSTLTLVIVGVIGLVLVLGATAVNQLALGMVLGAVVAVLLRRAFDRVRSIAGDPGFDLGWSPAYLVVVPVLLVSFRSIAVPRAADWSTNRAIRHSAPLIAEIESFRSRRGHYPLSLQSLHRDVSTGVVGLERFHYEPNGEAYNLYFVRPHVQLDAMEVVLFNPRNEHRFASHELDLLHQPE